jgi:hypothetical protein
MRLFFLLMLVSCASFHKETLKEQNDKATQIMCPCDRHK